MKKNTKPVADPPPTPAPAPPADGATPAPIGLGLTGTVGATGTAEDALECGRWALAASPAVAVDAIAEMPRAWSPRDSSPAGASLPGCVNAGRPVIAGWRQRNWRDAIVGRAAATAEAGATRWGPGAVGTAGTASWEEAIGDDASRVVAAGTGEAGAPVAALTPWLRPATEVDTVAPGEGSLLTPTLTEVPDPECARALTDAPGVPWLFTLAPADTVVPGEEPTCTEALAPTAVAVPPLAAVASSLCVVTVAATPVVALPP